jgi:predicted MarR family transcription regulator
MNTVGNGVTSEELHARSNLISLMELSLVILAQNFKRWTSICAASIGESRLSQLEWLVLIRLYYSSDDKRAMELAFLLRIEDLHLVNYAQRKLAKYKLVKKEKRGKEAYLFLTPAGEALCEKYFKARSAYLVQQTFHEKYADIDFENMEKVLKELSELYKDIAYSAALGASKLG